jgi:hypothetical protein
VEEKKHEEPQFEMDI